MSTLMLKDYLKIDDLTSCSSNGFKSFPRQQCCTTVGFLMEKKDLQIQRKNRNTTKTTHPPRKPAVTAFRRASGAVITAIKSLSQKKKASSNGFLSRSFSRKVLSRRFWRKEAKEQGKEGVVRCRRSFRQLLMQEGDYKTTSFNDDGKSIITVVTTVSSSGCGSKSWGGDSDEFTFSSNATSSFDNSVENEILDGVNDGKHKIQGITNGDWSNEKEQFSPVSVLNCTFEDDEHVMINSFFQGAEQKHMQKTRHFENVASQEPLILEKMIKCLEMEDEPLHKYHSTKQCSMINAENLLSDYFKQSMDENNNVNCCKVIEDWMKGKAEEQYLGWEVKEGRCVYISEMDKFGEWKNCYQETEQVVLELENDVFNSLVNEIVIDLM